MGRILSANEIKLLLDNCVQDLKEGKGRWYNVSDNRRRGLRDAAIITLGCGCGLRVRELLALGPKDYDARVKLLRITGRPYPMPVAEQTHEALALWLKRRDRYENQFFYSIPYSVGRGVREPIPQLTQQRLDADLRRRAARVEVDPFSMADLRRTFEHTLKSMKNPAVEQEIITDLMGRVRRTVGRDDKAANEAMREAVQRFAIPLWL